MDSLIIFFYKNIIQSDDVLGGFLYVMKTKHKFTEFYVKNYINMMHIYVIFFLERNRETSCLRLKLKYWLREPG